MLEGSYYDFDNTVHIKMMHRSTKYGNMFMVDFIYYERKKDKRKQKMSGKSSMWTCKILNNGRLFLEQIGKFA